MHMAQWSVSQRDPDSVFIRDPHAAKAAATLPPFSLPASLALRNIELKERERKSFFFLRPLHMFSV
jgi:hypothetical protein